MTRDELIEQAAQQMATDRADGVSGWYLADARDWLDILEPLIREQITDAISGYPLGPGAGGNYDRIDVAARVIEDVVEIVRGSTDV